MEVLLIILLLTVSGIFSGLTLGFMSMDVHELKRKSELGDARARALYPIRAHGNQLLVTLIVGNVLVNSILTVVLDHTTSGWLAVLIATILIVVFGEIVPQAVVSRYTTLIGAPIVPVIKRLVWLFQPVAKPLAALLDRAFGEAGPTFYSKDELVKILEEHSLSEESDIAADELLIVQHALRFGDKPIKTVMTPRSVVIAVKTDDKLTLKLINKLHKSGHSRFPVYTEDLDHIVGTLYLQNLLATKSESTVANVMSHDVFYVNEEEKLDHVLNAFYKTKHHLFVVVNEFGETVGVISIEDILEQIMGRKIVGEFDRYDDLRAVAKKQAEAKNSSLKIGHQKR